MDNKELWFSLIGEDLKAECDRLISLTDEMRAEGKIIFPEKKNRIPLSVGILKGYLTVLKK